MNDKDSSFMRLAAIGTWHCACPEARAASEAREAEESRRIENFRREMQKIAGYNFDLKITINGGCLEAVVDDLRFAAYEINSSKTEECLTVVTLLGRCSNCGVETMSEPFYDLAGLGKMLEKFEPIPWHYCKGPGAGVRDK